MAAENGMPDNEDVKKKALLRLAVAGVVTAAALGGLWWLDQGAEKTKENAGPPPAPIVPALPVETAPPLSEQPVEPPPPATGPTATEQAPAVQEPPPPPRVSNEPVRPAPAPAAPRSGTTPAIAPQPATVQAPRPASVPAAKLPSPPPGSPGPAPAGQGFVVQLGVFSNPDNARDMVDKLTRQGIRASLEARVQLGPFLNRQEAEKAQVEMRKLGYPALVTTAYPTK